jgi:hypothetical protein
MDAVAVADVRSTQLGPPPDALVAEVAAAGAAGVEAVGAELVAGAAALAAADGGAADDGTTGIEARAAATAPVAAAAAVAGAAAEVGATEVAGALPEADDFEEPPQPVRAIEHDTSTAKAAGTRAERSMGFLPLPSPPPAARWNGVNPQGVTAR